LGRLNKCGVISPRFDVKVTEYEKVVGNLLPSRQFGYIVLTTTYVFDFNIFMIFNSLIFVDKALFIVKVVFNILIFSRELLITKVLERNILEENYSDFSIK
jgi:hypothetical protein